MKLYQKKTKFPSLSYYLFSFSLIAVCTTALFGMLNYISFLIRFYTLSIPSITIVYT